MKTRTKKSLVKRIVIISAVSLVVIALGVYGWLSVQAWNSTSTTTAQASSNLKNSVDSTLATEKAPESVQTALNKIITDYNETLKKGPCELPSLYEWQSNLPWLKDTRQKCLDTTKSSDELATTLKNLQVFLQEETAAAKLIKEATDDTASATDYTAAAARWQKVSEDKSLITEDAFKPVGVKITEVSKGISDAYTALVTANGAQEKTAFDTAKQGLSDAYARLSEIKTTSSDALTGQVTIVVKVYENV